MALSLEQLRTRERPAADWIVPGLIKRGNTGFMIGPPKKGCKSWLELDLAWSLSEGEPVWGIKRSSGDYLFVPPRAMRVVMFAQEDTEDDVQDRAMAHFGQGRAANDRLWIIPKNWEIGFHESGRRLIQQELDNVKNSAGPIDLVIFDPFRRLYKGDENDSEAIAKVWEVLDRIHKRYGCATMFTHHIRKPPQDRTYYDPTDPFTARGSGDIYGGGDSFVMVVPRKLSKNAAGEQTGRMVELHFESKRGKPIPPAVVKVSFETGATEFMGRARERDEEQGNGEVNV